ncbi:MAG: DUF1573 domain-containing protein [Muribaculum sp.]|nr:DUF1573 domain-containing protein [Muribaculum sp.]
MKPLALLLLLMGVGIDVSADYTVHASPSVYEFGVMKEIAGSKTGRVYIVNDGPDPTYIRDVRPSCGCTAADYQKGTIAPGDSAWVSFTYNPKGRPGRFDKTVKVYTGDDSRKTVVKINGTVLGTPETLSTRYPVEMGALRLTEGSYNVGTVARGKSRHFFITAYNTTADSVAVRMESPEKWLDAEFPAAKIAPGDVAAASFYFNTRDVDRDGPIDLELPVYIDDSSEPAGAIRVYGKVVAGYEEGGAGVSEAPRAVCPVTLIPLGEVRPGKSREFSVVVENGGVAPLRIINAASEDSRIQLSLPAGEIAAGRRKVIKGKFKAGATDKGPQRISVELYTNDPLRPVTTVTVTAQVP